MQYGKIFLINIFEEKSLPPKTVKSVACSLDCGLHGDRFGRDTDRQITLINTATIDKMQEQKIKGLCFKRYSANLVVQGSKTCKLTCGDTLCCGDAEFVVSGEKRCFPECVLHQNKIECPLKFSAKYLKVTKSGSIKIGDSLESKL